MHALMQGEYGEKVAESRGKECELITRVNYTQPEEV